MEEKHKPVYDALSKALKEGAEAKQKLEHHRKLNRERQAKFREKNK